MKGGATHFTRLDLKQNPKKGLAILWPSIRDENPFVTDERTSHEALVVDHGTKIAVNLWFHMFDFTPLKIINADLLKDSF